ncbi:hypothetical protein [Ethanoligenens sp.]|uniref:hypothetical protein n=1 Tax=Ethanoligenens sp. TaxID=2099655 RepID=UPI0039EC5A68
MEGFSSSSATMAAVEHFAAQPPGVRKHRPEAVPSYLREKAYAITALVCAGAAFWDKRRFGAAAVEIRHKISSRSLSWKIRFGAFAPATFYADLDRVLPGVVPFCAIAE